MKIKLVCSAILSIYLCANAFAGQSIKIHAPHKESFACTEHWDGQFNSIGDALGTDCVIMKLIETEGRLFQKSYLNDGFKNEDWFGFEKNVLAPCDCVIESIHINEVVNEPGIMTPGRATSIIFRTKDGEFILIAHLRDITVKTRESVSAGQVVAKVGNNGYSRNPHVHIGAWSNDKTPLKIQFDQKTLSLEFRKGLGQ